MTQERKTPERGLIEELKSLISANRYILYIPLGIALVVLLVAVIIGSSSEGSFIYSLF